jgi:hypothetical protein
MSDNDNDVEVISREGSDLKLHVVDGTEVWLDTEAAVQDGVVVGTGEDRESAIRSAIKELTERVLDLVDALHKPGPPNKDAA